MKDDGLPQAHVILNECLGDHLYCTSEVMHHSREGIKEAQIHRKTL